MALQLTGAFKRYAVEFASAAARHRHRRRLDWYRYRDRAFVYYPVQVEKMLGKYEQVVAEFGEEALSRVMRKRSACCRISEHGREIRGNARAAAAGENRIFSLVRGWAVSRSSTKRLQDSPAYAQSRGVQKARRGHHKSSAVPPGVPDVIMPSSSYFRAVDYVAETANLKDGRDARVSGP